MIIKELLKECNIITSKNKVNPKFRTILENKPNVEALLLSHFNINTDDELKVTIRMILDNQMEPATCKMCSKITNYNFQYKKFNTYCSKKCFYSDPDVSYKGKQTKKERYGSEKYNNIKQILKTKKSNKSTL